MTDKKDNQRKHWTIKITIWTLFLAIIIGFASRYLFNEQQSLFVSFLILLTIIGLGIIFDLIGTAATAAEKGPINARATRKTPGSKKAVYLVKNADKVANFCCDVIGDISGIISGSLTTVIVVRLIIISGFNHDELYIGVLFIALVAAITVGGKSWGKTLAVKKATEVMIFTGLIISRLEKPFRVIKKKA